MYSFLDVDHKYHKHKIIHDEEETYFQAFKGILSLLFSFLTSRKIVLYFVLIVFYLFIFGYITVLPSENRSNLMENTFKKVLSVFRLNKLF